MAFKLKTNYPKYLKFVPIIASFVLLAIVSTFLLNNQTAKIANAGGTSSSIDSSSSKSSSSSEPLTINKSALTPLDDALNHDATLDRVNLVFYGVDNSGSLTDLRAKANETVFKKDLKNLDPYRYPMFNIEPYASNINKFNFWFYNEKIPNSDDSNFILQIREQPEIFGLDYVLPIRLTDIQNPDFTDTGTRSYANLPSLTYSNTTIDRYLPGLVHLLYFQGYETGAILAHEIGHALGGLADEYVETGNKFPRVSEPNCAPDKATATSWWGNIVGQIDPYFYKYRQALIDYYTSQPDPYYLRYNGKVLEEQIYDIESNTDKWIRVDDLNQIMDENNYKTSYIEGGCFSEATTGVVRPTKNSMMNTGLNVFGSVNRQRMEQVMQLFSGQIAPTTKKKPAYLDPSAFLLFKLGNADCTINTNTPNKKFLKCTVDNTKQKLVNRSNIYKIGIYKSDNYDDSEFTKAFTNSNVKDCNLNTSGDLFNCEGIDITVLDDKLDYRLDFFFKPGANSTDEVQEYPSPLVIKKLDNNTYDWNNFKLSLFAGGPSIVDPTLSYGGGFGSLSLSPDCATTVSVTIGTPYSCSFPISGQGPFILLEGGIQAKTGQGRNQSATSASCVVTGVNLDILSCNNIPSSSGGALEFSPGDADVILGVGTSPTTWTAQSAVKLVSSSSSSSSNTSSVVSSISSTTSSSISSISASNSSVVSSSTSSTLSSFTSSNTSFTSSSSSSVPNTIFIPDTSIIISPDPEANGLSIFGKEDYLLTIKDDRLVVGNSPASCEFKIKQIAAKDGDPDRGYEKLTSTILEPNYIMAGQYDSSRKIFRASYNIAATKTNPVIGATIKISKANQKFMDYKLKINCYNTSNSQIFSRDEKINFLFGAAAVTDIQGVGV